MPRAVTVGSVLAVSADRAVDQPLVLCLQRLPAHAKAVEHPGTEGLEQDVGITSKPEHDLAPTLVLEVDANRVLAPVQGQEQRAAGGFLRALVVRRGPPD